MATQANQKTDSIQIRCSTALKRKLQARAKDEGVDLTKKIWLALMAQDETLAADILAEL